MSDPLTDLISDIQHNGLRWVSFVTAANYIYNEFRKYKLDKRDEAMFHNIKILIEERGKGEWFAENPNSKRNMERRLLAFGLTTISHVLPVKLSIHRKETDPLISRRKKMKQLLSKKFLLAIVGVLIPIINAQFNIDLSLNDLIGIWTFLGVAIAAIAHVDSKQIKADLKTAATVLTADPNTTYRDMIKTVNVVHNAISTILVDLKKDDGSQAFRDACNAYANLQSIVNDFRKPDPLPEIPTIAEQKVS